MELFNINTGATYTDFERHFSDFACLDEEGNNCYLTASEVKRLCKRNGVNYSAFLKSIESNED